jgi:protein involved in polysaccharide export with SLBB domain
MAYNKNGLSGRAASLMHRPLHKAAGAVLRKQRLSMVLAAVLVSVSILSAQEEEQRTLEREDLIPSSQLALSSSDYQVTAGDIYTLFYIASGTPISYRIIVDSGYRIRISNLGVINAAGKTFLQLKTEAEAIVSKNYPLSGVQLVLTQPAVFRVFVNGEVRSATEVSTWALARLSSLAGYMTPYGSTRNITVRSGNGRIKNYDLFQAGRMGDLSQDPYLRPDDVITFNRLERKVTITGAIERPGEYELLAGEHLKDLIGTYACGFTHLADKARIELTRYTEISSVSGEKILLKENDIQRNYILKNHDVITVPNITNQRPAAILDLMERRIVLEGAVRRPGMYYLLPGENLRDLIEIYGEGLTPAADPSTVEIIRYANGDSASVHTIVVGEKEIGVNFELTNYDIVTIFSR